MGNSKFLIVIVSVLTAVALICLGVSAEEPERGLVREPSGTRSVPSDTPPSSLFKTTYRYYTNSNNTPSQMASATEDSPIYCFYFYISDGMGTVISATSDENVPLWIGPVGAWQSEVVLHFGEDVYTFHNYQFGCDLVSYTPFTHDFGSLWTAVIQSPSFDIGSLFNAILGIGGMLLSFVTSNAIVLLPIVSWLGIFAIACIRRLVKGV